MEGERVARAHLRGRGGEGRGSSGAERAARLERALGRVDGRVRGEGRVCAEGSGGRAASRGCVRDGGVGCSHLKTGRGARGCVGAGRACVGGGRVVKGRRRCGCGPVEPRRSRCSLKRPSIEERRRGITREASEPEAALRPRPVPRPRPSGKRRARSVSPVTLGSQPSHNRARCPRVSSGVSWGDSVGPARRPSGSGWSQRPRAAGLHR